MDLLLLRYRRYRWAAWALFAGLAYGPLAGALLGAASESPSLPADLFSPRRVELLLRSLGFSLAISAVATTCGVLAAIALLRQLPRRAARWQWLLVASVALPPTVPALAWSQGFSLLQPLTGTGAIGSWLYAGIAQGMALLPFATGVAVAALGRVDPELLDAARLQASPARLIARIALPLAAPTIAAGAALVFLLSLLDYTIPAIFGANVYALEIFVAFSSNHRVADAFWLSLPLAACALLLATTLAGLPQRLAQGRGAPFPADGTLPPTLTAAILVAGGLCAAALAAPLIGIAPAFADPAYLGRTIATSGREALYTLLTSTGAALLAVALAIVPALELARGGQMQRLCWALCLLPFLLPPALTGIGLIALWSPIHVIDLYGTAGMTVAAETARFTPAAIVVLATWLLRTDPALVDAALVAGSSLRQIVARVLLPLAAPGLAAAAGIAFVLSLGDIGANLLVTPAGSATLGMKTYNYLHYGGSEAAAGLCLLLVGLAALGAAATTLGMTWSRLPR